MRTYTTTPEQDGFRMSGEFGPHEGCWIIWPERPDNQRLGAKPAQKVFVEVAKATSCFEPVTVCVSNAQYDNARCQLPEDVCVMEMSVDGFWIRDCGPAFVTNGTEVRGVDWSFNVRGGLADGLYFPWDKDDHVVRKVCDIGRKGRYRLDNSTLEGGSIHVDGEGILIATEECLSSEGRNSHLTKEEIEDVLKEYLNLEKTIWIPYGIYNDETNGHVDNITHHTAPGQIILAQTDDKDDPRYDIYQKAYKMLRAETDAKGRKLNIHKLTLPRNILITRGESEGVDAVDGMLPRMEGDRLAASYANLHIANGGIVFPMFHDENDEKARRTLGECFPGRGMAGIYAREILLGGDNIHCITQQQPKVREFQSGNKIDDRKEDRSMSRIVIALGGNALGDTPKEQQERIDNAAPVLIGLTKQGHEIIISHGDGPQVEMLRQASDTASAANEKVPAFKLSKCTAMGQGYIGFHLQKRIKKELCREGMPWYVATMVTQIVVDRDNPALPNSTKPIGSFYTVEGALKMMRENPKLHMKEDAGRGHRQMVALPKPMDTAERSSTLNLLDHEFTVIACGGGGISVILDENGDYEGIPVVVDKDSASVKLAELVDADYLFILTVVDRVAVNYRKPEQRELKETTVEEAENLCREGHFALGSMLPKVEAAMEFARSERGRNAVISSLEKVPLAMIGESRARIAL